MPVRDADPFRGRIAGVDEAGRGPLAGPVVIAAVILDPARPIRGLADSKQLSPATRLVLADQIYNRALAVSVSVIEVEDIDRLNILQATLKGMTEAVAGLQPEPLLVRVDGNRAPQLSQPVQTVIGGDRSDRAIGAASIVAKVHRDHLMVQLHDRFPAYGFDRHKGYPTRAHLEALERHGPCPVHRRSFRPVAQFSLF